MPGYVDVMGVAFATNSVTVNGQTAYRKVEYFRQQLAVTNTSGAVWLSVTNAQSGQATVPAMCLSRKLRKRSAMTRTAT